MPTQPKKLSPAAGFIPEILRSFIRTAISRSPDRSKDVIISGGENISSVEVEEVIYRMSGVLNAAVVAQPDDTWGETPCALSN